MARIRNRLIGYRQRRLFSLFGFEVKVDLSWLLLALLITWTLGVGVFPIEYPGLSTPTYVWMGIACAIGVFFSIVFHEFSHSIVARRFGMPIRGITLFIFGGVAEMEREPPSPRSEFFMAAAGPIASFVLALLCSNIGTFAVARAWPVSVAGVFEQLAFINYIVAIFNLVPAFPLDGGRILRAALWNWKGDMLRATQISSRIGSGFGLALMFLGGVAFIQGNFIGGMWWFLIGVFLRGAAAASLHQLLLQELVQDQPVSQFMRRDPISVPPTSSVQDWIDNYVYRHHFKMFPVVDGSTLLGCINIEGAKRVPRSDWQKRTVAEIMEPVTDENSVAAETSAMELLSTMVRADGKRRFMVVEQGRLVGMISLKDLLEVIALKLEIEASGNK